MQRRTPLHYAATALPRRVGTGVAVGAALPAYETPCETYVRCQVVADARKGTFGLYGLAGGALVGLLGPGVVGTALLGYLGASLIATVTTPSCALPPPLLPGVPLP